MREIAEIELAIQGGTEKIETLGKDLQFRECLYLSSVLQVNKEKLRNQCGKWLLSRL